MKFFSPLITVLGTMLAMQSATAGPRLDWSITVDTGASTADRCKAVGTMTNGDVIAAYQIGSGTGAQIRVQRLAAINGVAIWTRDVGTANFSDDPVDVAVDPATGDSYIAARAMTASNGLDWLVFKVNGADGTLGWAGSYIFGSTGNDEPRAICFAQDGNVIVAGMTTVSGVSTGQVAKLNSSTGATLASVNINGGSIDLFDVACDASGNVIAAGRFDNGALVVKYASVSGGTLNLSGTHQFNPGGRNCWNAVAFISGGDFVAAGYTNAGSSQSFGVARYASALGVPTWTREIVGSANDNEAAFDVTVDGTGDVYAAGFLRDSVNGQMPHVTKLDGGTGAIIWGTSRNGSSANANATDAFYTVRVIATDVFALGTQANATPDMLLTRCTTAGVLQEDMVFDGAANNQDTSLNKNLLATNGTLLAIGGDTENATPGSDGIVRSYNLVEKAVSITALDAAKAEGNGGGTSNFTFTVARTGDLSDAVTLDWTVTGSGVAAANSADFAALTGQVTLNTTEASRVVTVTVNADSIVEPNEGFTITLSNPTNGYVLDGATADGTIQNDDSATLILTGGGSASEGNAGTTTRTYTATLSNAVQSGFSVAYTTDDGTATTGDSDYVDNDGSLTFIGNTGEVKTISVTVNSDGKVEANEDFDVSLGLVTGSTVTVVDTSTASTITNDDSATISITDVSQSESGGSMSFSVTLSAPADVAVSADFATAANTAVTPADFGSNSGTLTFPANSNTTQTATVTIVNDGDFEADETFYVNLSNLSASGRSVTLADAQGLGTIQNDDTLTVTITATDDSADENLPETGTWRVSRNGSLGALLVNLEVDAASTGVAADWTQTGASFVSMEPGGIGTVTIPDGDSFVDIVLTPVDDLAAEADEEIILNVTGSAGYTVSIPVANTITIGRNDFGVTNVNDSGEGSLRQAVENANVLGGNPTVTFEGPVFSTSQTITLTGGMLTATANMTVQGLGADVLTVSGNLMGRIFAVSGGAGLELRDLKLTNGVAPVGDDRAGAVLVDASTLSLVRCWITGCRAGQSGAVEANPSGTVNILSSTISSNTSSNSGGAITLFGGTAGILNVTNSTFTDNEAVSAGAIFIGPSTVVTIRNSTISGNRATGSSGGGIISVNSTLSLGNTIVAGNTSASGGPDYVNTFTSVGGNLIGDDTDTTIVSQQASDQVGTGASPIDPLLGALASNGGPTPTLALLVGSPAIDAGDPAFDGSAFMPALTTDQRGTGFVRVSKGIAISASALVDIGAFELVEAPVFTEDDLEINTGSAPLDLTTASGVTPSGGVFSGTGVSGGFFDPTGLGLGSYTVTYTVTDVGGSTNGTDLTVTVTEVPSLTVTAIGDVVSKVDGQTSLREALEYAATLTGPQTVIFSNSTTNGAVDFHDAAPDTIVLGGSELVIEGDVTIEGPGTELLTLDGDGASGIFYIPGTDPGDVMALRDLTLFNGAAPFGGGILVNDGDLTVERCVIRDNLAGSGGGIGTFAGNLSVIDCVITGNETDTDSGGGLFIDGGTVRIVRTTVRDNDSFLKGGGAFFSTVTAVIIDSLIEDNLADSDGGGVHLLAGGTLDVINSTLSNNTTTTGRGGAIFSEATLTVTQSTLTGNATAQDGGGICAPAGTATVANTLIAGNTATIVGPDVFGSFTDEGSNLVGIDGGSTGFTVSTLLGTTATPLDPLLGPLSDNGGATFTHALLVGSPAIDAGDDALALDAESSSLVNDQRGGGFVRISKGSATSLIATVDIGAFELFSAPLFTENTLRILNSGGPLNLASATGATPGGGSFSGMGVSGDYFDPAGLALGDYTVTYTIEDAYGNSNTAQITVTVFANPAKLVVKKPKRFAATEVGKRSRTQQVRVSNRGGESVSSIRIVVKGSGRKDFRIVKPVLRVLEPGQSTTFKVTFAPRKVGTRKATVTLLSNQLAVTMNVKGTGKFNLKPLRL